MIDISYVLPDGEVKKSVILKDGLTLNQSAEILFPDEGGKFPAPVIAVVGSKPAVRELGDWDFPLSDACVQFRQLALGGGGGSNPLQMVMQIAVIALAVTASMWVGGTGLFAAEGILSGMGLGLGSFAGGLAGAGVMLLGSMLTGALFPQKMPQGQLGASSAAQASPTYSINASGNQARLYQTEPEGFGRMKIVPDFVANTWTQYIGNDQIGYFVYGIGRGRYEVESLQFGETVFWRNGALVEGTGYEIQDIEFVEPGEAVTIFPDNVITSDEVSGQELFGPNDEEFDGPIGPYATNPPGTKTNKLLFDFVLQQGIGQYNDEGELQNYTVSWRIEYQAIDDFGNALSEWAVLSEISYSDPQGVGTLTPQRITNVYDVAEGRYQCRVVRTSDTAGDGKTLDNLVWGAMRAMLPGTYAYPISCIAFSIKASNALTQSASTQFSAIVLRKLPLYDRNTQTWGEEKPTRSWAAAISHVCKCEWGGRLDDSNIDLDALWRIDEKLQEKGWNYDAYIDGAYLVWTLISEMCQSQCVIPRLLGPVLSFVIDEADRPPTFSLTPRNIVRNSFAVNYITWSDETPDDVTVDYLDADYGFQQRDVTAVLPESESREPSSLSILGITNRKHAHNVAIRYAAHNRWQRVVVECQTECLGRVLNRGDIGIVAHPRFKNTASGVIVSWDEGRLELTLKKDMSRMLPEGEYDKDTVYIGLTRQDGSVWGPCKLASIKKDIVSLDSADYATLLLQGQENPFEWITPGIDRMPTTWTIYTAKAYQRRMVVESVSSQDALRYTLKLSNDDSRIYQYDSLPVPPWQGRGQLPTVDTLGVPENFRGVIQNQQTVILVWAGTPGASWYDVEISTTGNTWTKLGRTNISQMTVTVAPGIVYARVRASRDNMESGWAIWSGNTTVERPKAPSLELDEGYFGGNALVIWDTVENAIQYAVTLKKDEQSVYAARTENTSFTVTPDMQRGGPFRNMKCIVRAVGEAGTSEDAAINLFDPAPNAPATANVIAGETSITLESVSPDDAIDKTGYVLLRGDASDFGINQVIEMRKIDALPYTWEGLTAGTYYFRVAIKDAFFDISGDLMELNWSPALEITIGDEDGE